MTTNAIAPTYSAGSTATLTTTNSYPASTHPPLESQRLSVLLRQLIRWSVVSVAVAIAIDILVRFLIPDESFWLHVMILGGITIPLLLLGGHYFVRKAAQLEQAVQLRHAETWRQARQDSLTRVDNRLALSEHIETLANRAPQQTAALFILDLHEFQRINDACGHDVGDAVLREVCERLRGVANRHQAAAPAASNRRVRIGSDEIGLWLPQWHEHNDARAIARDMLGVLEAPFLVGPLSLYVRGSIGYLVATAGSLSGNDWLTRTTAATQQAKRLGAGTAMAFASEHMDTMLRRHTLQQALQAAVHGGGGLSLHYQPIVTLDNGQLVGCEALLRWQHADWGAIAPADFIPVAEGSDLIRPLGRWVLHAAVQQLATWQSQPQRPGNAALRMSVNLSRAQLHDPTLTQYIATLLQDHQVAPATLRLEVTESLPLDDPASISALEQLRDLGLSLALDDFGTGYSSLSALLQLPIRSVKIDRQFVMGIERCPYRQALVAGVLRVAQVMHLDVVAEGIEHEAEANTLRDLGCHHMQGWFISRALPADRFAREWLYAQPTARLAQVSLAPQPHGCQSGQCGLPQFAGCAMAQQQTF